MDENPRSLDGGVAEQRTLAERRTKIRKSPKEARAWPRLFFDNRVIARLFIIRRLPDRGFKSRPRNQFFAEWPLSPRLFCVRKQNIARWHRKFCKMEWV